MPIFLRAAISPTAAGTAAAAITNGARPLRTRRLTAFATPPSRGCSGGGAVGAAARYLAEPGSHAPACHTLT